jgi:hypothetical protein
VSVPPLPPVGYFADSRRLTRSHLLPVALLSQLITRSANGRLTSLTLPSHPFFSNLAISTLLFLDRSNFSSKTKEEKASFLRGLVGVVRPGSPALGPTGVEAC